MTDSEAFARELAQFLRLEDEDRFHRNTGLFEDWGLDSLQAFEMIVTIEAMAGAVVPPPHLPELFTVGEAFDYYQSLLSRPGRPD